MISQKEFMIGCLIGSAIGAVAVAVSANYGAKLNGFHTSSKKKGASHALAAVKHAVTKKRTKKTTKHKAR